MKTLTTVLLTLLVVFLLGAGVFIYVKSSKKVTPDTTDTSTNTAINPSSAAEKPDGKHLIGGDKDEHGCLIGAGYSWCEVKQKCQRMWEETCITPEDEAALVDAVKKAIIAKRGQSASTLVIKATSAESSYAKGSATPPVEDVGGGMWFAAKVNGKWELVWDGNGNILCADLEKYPNFPSSYIPECYNEKTDKTVLR